MGISKDRLRYELNIIEFDEFAITVAAIKEAITRGECPYSMMKHHFKACGLIYDNPLVGFRARFKDGICFHRNYFDEKMYDSMLSRDVKVYGRRLADRFGIVF